MRAAYHSVREAQEGKVWKNGKLFRKAYLIHLYEEMLDAGQAFHMVTTDGQYMEVDTEEDFAQANQHWPEKYGNP